MVIRWTHGSKRQSALYISRGFARVFVGSFTVSDLFADFYGQFRGRENVASARTRVYVPNK